MEFITAKAPHPTKRGGPVWELAKLFPEQGCWTEEDYLGFDRSENLLMEFTDGYLEVLPMPTIEHQRIVKYLVRMLMAFAEPALGEVLFAPLPMKMRTGMWREPDVFFILKEHLPKGEYPEHADLVFEIVSPDKKSQQRDYKMKRLDYAKAGIAEYWIVDPKKEQITILKLARGRYVEHGVFKTGSVASSALLKGFAVDVAKVLMVV